VGSSLYQNDSIKTVRPVNDYYSIQLNATKDSKFINIGAPSSITAANHQYNSTKTAIFYLLAGLLLMLGILKILFPKYFFTLFKVFFNTSLKQGQLTDQLLIAKLQSLIFNLFFIITVGIYIYFLLLHFKRLSAHNTWINIFLSIGVVGLVYIVKYLSLKFIGWVTEYKAEIDTYIFIIFLINKIIGILLVPFVVIVAFSDAYIVHIVILISLLIIIILLFLRFIRSYELLHKNIKVSQFHFFLYIIGIELLPLLLIYKALLIFLIKNS
jgi:hypothetical protein